ncbi:MAG: DUF4140 domain-containing protein, partial [Planctomycetes bacterium]|nr:DUF4140 domain-containing protein [Planctomycetota bacterium]
MTNAEQRGFESRATQVTFFEDRAEVTRRAKVRIPAGKGWVVLEGVSPFIDDRSVRAKPLDEGVTLLGVRVLRRLDSVRIGDPADLATAAAAEGDARIDQAGCLAKLQEARRSLQRLQQLQAAWSQGIARVPHGLASDRSGWGEGYQALATAAQGAVEEVRAEGVLHDEANRALADAARATSRLEGLRSRWEAAVEVQLEAANETELEVEIAYRTPCALWRPEHLVRLERDSEEAADGRLVLTTFATAWQATGERWEGVEATFSTARPGRAAEAPLAEDDTLYTREKTSQERREVVVAARDEQVNLAGLDRGRRQVDEMPGVDDGGEPLTIEASEPVTIPSTGRPFRISTGSRTLKAGLVRIAIPELAAVAHLRATATLS